MTPSVLGLTWLECIVIFVAAARLARLVTTDDILDGPRDWLVGYRDPKTRTWVPGKLREGSKIATLITCNWCSGWWLTLATLLAWVHGGSGARWVVVAFALAGGQAFLNSLGEPE